MKRFFPAASGTAEPSTGTAQLAIETGPQLLEQLGEQRATETIP